MANEYGGKFAQLKQLQQKLGDLYSETGELAVDPLTGETTKPRRGYKVGKKYADLYDWLSKQGADMSGFGQYSREQGGSWSPYVDQQGQAAALAEQQAAAAGGTTGGATTEHPYAGEADVEYDFSDLMNAIVKGLPTGININTEKGAKTIEAVYPLIKEAYNMRMQAGAIDVGYDALGELKQDETLKATADLVTNRLANPYTYDEETVGLMRSATADQIAMQEAAMGERLRSMGATQGISPDSPLYASLAAQATMARDINLANAERQLQVQMAQQKMADEKEAIGLGSAFGGSYQNMLQQAYGNLANLYSGSRLSVSENPFAGIWQGTLMANELGQSPESNPLAGALSGGMQGASAGAAFGPWGAVIGGVAGAGLGYASS